MLGGQMIGNDEELVTALVVVLAGRSVPTTLPETGFKHSSESAHFEME